MKKPETTEADASLIGADRYSGDVVNCARCGENHDLVEWRRFTDKPSGRHTHWATCPATGDPILQTAIPGDRETECIDLLSRIWELEDELMRVPDVERTSYPEETAQRPEAAK